MECASNYLVKTEERFLPSFFMKGEGNFRNLFNHMTLLSTGTNENRNWWEIIPTDGSLMKISPKKCYDVLE